MTYPVTDNGDYYGRLPIYEVDGERGWQRRVGTEEKEIQYTES